MVADSRGRQHSYKFVAMLLLVFLILPLEGYAQIPDSVKSQRRICTDVNLNKSKQAALREAIASASDLSREGHGRVSTDSIISQSLPLIHVGGMRNGKSDVLVYLTGNNYCGSGGCNALIFSGGSDYKLVGRLMAVRLPILAFKTATSGWHDLGVTVSGGGILQSSVVRIRFGKSGYHRGNILNLKNSKMVDAASGTVLLDYDAQDQCLLK